MGEIMKKPLNAPSICRRAADLMSGDRAKTHGPKYRNHANIAEMWNAYLSIRRDRLAPLTPANVAIMVALLKVARSELGAFNLDDYVDGAAYFGIAGELEVEKVP